LVGGLELALALEFVRLRLPGFLSASRDAPKTLPWPRDLVTGFFWPTLLAVERLRLVVEASLAAGDTFLDAFRNGSLPAALNSGLAPALFSPTAAAVGAGGTVSAGALVMGAVACASSNDVPAGSATGVGTEGGTASGVAVAIAVSTWARGAGFIGGGGDGSLFTTSGFVSTGAAGELP